MPAQDGLMGEAVSSRGFSPGTSGVPGKSLVRKRQTPRRVDAARGRMLLLRLVDESRTVLGLAWPFVNVDRRIYRAAPAVPVFAELLILADGTRRFDDHPCTTRPLVDHKRRSMINNRRCRSPVSNKPLDQRLAEARFRTRAQRGQGQTERGLELLRKAAGEPRT